MQTWVKVARAAKAGPRKAELLQQAVRNHPSEAPQRLRVQRILEAPVEIRTRLVQLRLEGAPLPAAHWLLEEQ